MRGGVTGLEVAGEPVGTRVGSSCPLMIGAIAHTQWQGAGAEGGRTVCVERWATSSRVGRALHPDCGLRPFPSFHLSNRAFYGNGPSQLSPPGPLVKESPELRADVSDVTMPLVVKPYSVDTTDQDITPVDHLSWSACRLATCGMSSGELTQSPTRAQALKQGRGDRPDKILPRAHKGPRRKMGEVPPPQVKAPRDSYHPGGTQEGQ